MCTIAIFKEYVDRVMSVIHVLLSLGFPFEVKHTLGGVNEEHELDEIDAMQNQWVTVITFSAERGMLPFVLNKSKEQDPDVWVETSPP